MKYASYDKNVLNLIYSFENNYKSYDEIVQFFFLLSMLYTLQFNTNVKQNACQIHVYVNVFQSNAFNGNFISHSKTIWILKQPDTNVFQLIYTTHCVTNNNFIVNLHYALSSSHDINTFHKILMNFHQFQTFDSRK